LIQSKEKIEEYSKALEQRVQERTHELLRNNELRKLEMIHQCADAPDGGLTAVSNGDQFAGADAKTESYYVSPIIENRLISALNTLVGMTRNPVEVFTPILQPITPSSGGAQLSLLPVKSGETISLLRVESIVHIRAEGKYSIITTKEKKHFSNYSISELEERLGTAYFIRVNRSTIVNLKHVSELRKGGAMGKFKVIVDVPSNEDIIVSNNYLEVLKQRLKME
jgi:DNA-binding LytR/AlgR family response regulator